MKKLESGKSYKLTDLFKDDRHIIIPDLQRDYCWGDYKDEKGKPAELVSGFLDNLSAICKEEREIKLGMIYAYEYPKGSNRIYLCDGQQRITTLFLLLGMIHKNIENKNIEKFLISEYELTDDQEPRLLYAIRETTLYFLSDLVCNFFLTNTVTKVSEIKKPLTKWYFNEYNLDPTIQSMISAMEIIENKLSDLGDLEKLAEFLLNKIEFFYFDMKNRETGEDMFVVINTTGEPLTATENIKPILIGNIENDEKRKTASDLWEKWEKWFWMNKGDSEHEADQGLNSFFVYYWQIKLLQEKQWKDKKPYDINPFQIFTQYSEIEANEETDFSILLDDINNAKSITEIDKYFFAYQKLFDDFQEKANQDVLNSIKSLNYKKANCLRELPINVVLPLIQFKIKYPEESITPFLRRLRKNYYDGLWDKRNENYINWRHLIQLIDKSTSIENLFCFSDNSNFKNISGVLNNNIENWYNTEEQLKDELKKENSILIETIEDHQDFMGDLRFFLFEVNQSGNNINCNVLNKYYNNFKNTIDRIRVKDDSKPVLSNYVRLLLLMNNCNKVGHLWKCSWDFEGVLFSTLSTNRNYLRKTDIKELCSLEKEEKIISFCKERISTKIKEIDSINLENFSTEKFIKWWLILKVLNAEKENCCISYYDGDGTGIAAYRDKDSNKLLPSEEFSLSNSICGFGVRSGFGAGNTVRTTTLEFWLNSNAIDTPFTDVAFDPNYWTKEQIQKNQDKIDELIAEVENW